MIQAKIMDTHMNDDEFDLTPILLHNAALTVSLSPAPAQLPQVLPRPISKRRGKKRSSRACTTCRSRKVRCNIVAHGAPCSNCRHDEIECILPLSRRQKSARERAEASLRESMAGSDAGNSCNATVRNETNTSAHLHDGLSRVQSWSRAQSISNHHNLAPHGMPLQDYALAEILPANTITPPQTHPNSIPQTSSRTISWIQLQAPLASAPPSTCSSPSTHPGATLSILPRVFTPFPRHLDSPDLSYLQSRDALTIPSEAMQVELLKAYIEFVHGSMPILDVEEFLSAVKYGYGGLDGQKGKGIDRENENRKQISFLLFQAVMFAGIGYVSTRVLKEAGYNNRESTKRVFFNRVRLLYDFDTCIDRLSIIQSLLLMTLCPTNSSSKDGKDAWHWLGLAISLSYSLGLNRNIPAANPTIRRKHLERRVWWTAFIRDRTLALNSSGTCAKPVRIKREDCNVEILSLEDFDIDEAEEKNETGDEIKARKNAVECVEKAMLCWCSNDGLVSSFSSTYLSLPPPSAMQTPNIFIPRQQFNQESEEQQQLYSSNSTSFETPVFESPEYNIAGSSSPSMHDDCITPREEIPEFVPQEAESKVICSSQLGGGFGVDGEYDDYLEYLKVPGAEQEQEQATVARTSKGKDRATWAFQFDCENDRVLEV